MMIDLIALKAALAAPDRLTRYTFWQEHIPFGMYLVSAIQPRVLVELGAHYGDSYAAFCQTVKALGLKTLCYAIDNWKGDLHYGEYGEEVLADLRAHHDARYESFSLLLQSDFAAACKQFRDGSIDLLHIDGTHTYEAVKRDFEMWLPKMSPRGVVLLHDTNVVQENFGVKQFFRELKTAYPHFEFTHGYGLGVLGVGSECPDEARALFSLNETDIAVVREIFATLGGGLTQRLLKEKELSDLLTAARIERERSAQTQVELQSQLADAQRMNDELRQTLHITNQNLELISNSRGWRLLQGLWGIKRALTRRGQVIPRMPLVENQPPLSTEQPDQETADVAPLEPAQPAQTEVRETSPISTISERIPPDVIETLTRQARERLTKLPAETVRLVALYLPQFHHIPENDQWWGEGFTEWTNTRKATPLFAGHYQPHIPAELGYYDLSNPGVLERQAALAREYGIYGFCYYYYWFTGKRLLERPVETMLASRKPDFPFCFLWANENWTRRWDGMENEILQAQEHSHEDDLRFIQHLIPAFRDPRYIRINGRPLLILYRIGSFTMQSIEMWRAECQKVGVGDIYIAATMNSSPLAAAALGKRDPRLFGCDAAMEFPPHGVQSPLINHRCHGLAPDFQGWIYDYLETMTHYINRPPSDYAVFRGVMTSWDNTPRRQNAPHIYAPHSPELYGYWLSYIVEQTIERHTNPDERLIFINAWNEWAEGAHLEPDEEFGRRYLEETKQSLSRA